MVRTSKTREAMRSRPTSPSCYLSLHCCPLLPTGLGLRAKASRLSNPELSTYSLLSWETSGLQLVELRLPCSGTALCRPELPSCPLRLVSLFSLESVLWLGTTIQYHSLAAGLSLPVVRLCDRCPVRLLCEHHSVTALRPSPTGNAPSQSSVVILCSPTLR